MDLSQFETRKRDHIQHALNPAHQAAGKSGLERLHLHHDSLPELDFNEIGLDSICLGKPSRTPFYVSGMTAGHADALWINEALASACDERGWAMGVGSQRRDLEGPAIELDRWREFRKRHPRLVVFANLGASQVIRADLDFIRRITDSIEAQALAVHANALQECLQPEGTPRFRGVLQALERLVSGLGLPVILKETGCGFSRAALEKLKGLKLGALDVSGLGGTHWGRIEGARAPDASREARAAATFADWGESTLDSVLAAREILPAQEIWASGGVRTGLDAAKLIALGAQQVGYAQPALQVAIDAGRLKDPVKEPVKALVEWMELQEYELRVALMCTGCASPGELRRKRGVWAIV